jgi:hypothetical protein
MVQHCSARAFWRLVRLRGCAGAFPDFLHPPPCPRAWRQGELQGAAIEFLGHEKETIEAWLKGGLTINNLEILVNNPSSKKLLSARTPCRPAHFPLLSFISSLKLSKMITLNTFLKKRMAWKRGNG